MSRVTELFLPPIRMRRYVGVALFVWTLIFGVILTAELFDEQRQARDVLLAEARGIAARAQAYFRWNVVQGGIYIAVLPEREGEEVSKGDGDRLLTTATGEKLRLVSPKEVINEVDRLAEKSHEGRKYSVRFLGMKSSRSKLVPDAWEEAALKRLEQVNGEVVSIAMFQGEKSLRLMQPIDLKKVPERFAKEFDYEPGSLWGGVAVSIPLELAWPMEWREMMRRVVGYGLAWLFGLFGIVGAFRQLFVQIHRREEAEELLRDANDQLEGRVAERTAELAKAKESLESEIVERKQAEKWLLESEERFRGFFELGDVGMAILTPEGEWSEVNRRLCQMLGYTQEELWGKTWGELTEAKDWEGEEGLVERMRKGLIHDYSIEKRFVRQDGKLLESRVSVRSLRRSDGELDSMVAVVEEIKHPT